MYRLLSKAELLILLRIRPYTTLVSFKPKFGLYECFFKSSGDVVEAPCPSFLLSRMLLKSCTLLTAEDGIGVTYINMTLNGRTFYASKTVSVERQDMVSNLEPLIEEAILPEILSR